MNTPDPMKKLFAEYTVTVTAEVPIDDADRLWRKAKRRRSGQVAAAGTAALALIAPAMWLLASTAGASEQPRPQPGAFGSEGAVEESELPEQPEADHADANDLVGATVDLPSFAGDADIDEVCGVGDAVIADGQYHGAGAVETPEEGEAFILGTTFAVVTEEDRAYVAEGDYDYTELSLVGFFGCDAGDELVFQIVVLEEAADGAWTATRLVHSEPGGESLKGMMAGDGMELLVGFVERWEPTPDPEAVHWVERVELGEDAVVREPTDYDYWSLVIDMSPMFPVD